VDRKLLRILRGGCVATLLLGVLPAPAAAWPPGEPPPAAAAAPGRLRGDLGRLGSRQTLLILASTGAAAGLASWGDTNEESGPLTARPLEGVADAANVYGTGWFLGGASLGVLGAGAVSGNAALTDLGWDLGESLAITGVVVTGLKIAVGRTRPDGGHWSFPSGHSAAAFCVVPALARHAGWKTGAAAALAASTVAMARLEDRRHYLSDVVFGAGIGLAVGRATSHEPRNPALSLEPGLSSLALVARF